MRRLASLFLVVISFTALAAAASPDPLDPKFDGVTKEQALKTIHDFTFVQFVYLLSFKNNPDFAIFGFGRGGQYHKWEETNDKLRNYASKACEHFGVKEGTDEARPFFICTVVRGLGAEYLSSGGQETDFSLEFKDYVMKFYGMDLYSGKK